MNKKLIQEANRIMELNEGSNTYLSVVEVMKQLDKKQRDLLDNISLKMNVQSADLVDVGKLNSKEITFMYDLNDLYDGEVEWIKRFVDTMIKHKKMDDKDKEYVLSLKNKGE